MKWSSNDYNPPTLKGISCSTRLVVGTQANIKSRLKICSTVYSITRHFSHCARSARTHVLEPQNSKASIHLLHSPQIPPDPSPPQLQRDNLAKHQEPQTRGERALGSSNRPSARSTSRTKPHSVAPWPGPAPATYARRYTVPDD